MSNPLNAKLLADAAAFADELDAKMKGAHWMPALSGIRASQIIRALIRPNPATSSSDRIEAARKALADWDSTSPTYQDGLASGLAEALRALIESPATMESPEQIAERVMYSEPVPHDRTLAEWRQKIAEGVQAGIQAAWQSWEPETTPAVISTPITGGEIGKCRSCGIWEYLEEDQVKDPLCGECLKNN